MLVACLGLGIGVNAAVFGIFNAALLQGPTATDPNASSASSPATAIRFPTRTDRDLRDTPGFAGFALSAGATLHLQNGDAIDKLSALQVLAELLRTARRPRLRGTHVLAGGIDTGAGGRAPSSSTHGFWQRRFQGDDRIIGRALMLSGEPFTVIGVLAPGHRHGMALYVPDLARADQSAGVVRD